jgi:S1-C subfamily serine protease
VARIDTTSRRPQATLARNAALLGLACLLSGSLGCSILGIGLRRERIPETPPDTPIWRRPAASELLELPSEDVVRRADATLVEIPLHSHTIRRISEQAMPAVVSIYTKTPSPYMFSLLPIPLPGFYFRLPLPGEALGSAFFIHPGGYLLSNNHVIENALSIRARTSEEDDYDLEIVARDPVLDIALLRVVEPEAEFEFIPVGDSSEVGVGDSVIAIGNPLGLGHSVSQGIISQTGRELIKLDEGDGRQIEFLQTDTAINPGSSGGPLITLSGAAVGMNTAIARSAQGIAFAVPTSQILEFIEQVLAGEGIDDPRTPAP